MNLQQLLDRIKQLQSKLSTQQQVTLGLAFVAVVALIAGASWYLSAPEYRVLFTNMDAEEASQVEKRLTDQKVSYRLANGGRDIEVPKEEVDRLRVSFSSDGLPASGRIGFDDAVELLVNEAAMARSGAEAEVRRYTFTPGYQLSYLYGKHLLLQLRQRRRRVEGAGFDLRAFHDTLLYAGALPAAVWDTLFER